MFPKWLASYISINIYTINVMLVVATVVLPPVSFPCFRFVSSIVLLSRTYPLEVPARATNPWKAGAGARDQQL